MPRTVVFTCLRGGVGKTTSTLALAGIYAREGQNVLIVDGDPQSSATLQLRHHPVEAPWEAPVVVPVIPTTEDYPGSIRLARGGRTLAGATDRQVAAFFDREGDFADVVLVDTSPAYPNLLLAALATADLAVVPMEPNPASLPGLNDVHKITRQLDPAVPLRILFTRVNARRRVTRETSETVDRRYPGLTFDVRVPDDARVPEAAGYGVPVTVFDAACRASQAYDAAVTAIDAELAAQAGAGR